MKNYSKSIFQLLIFGVFFLFQSCSIQLAPKFDQVIVTNLTVVTEDIFKVLAEVAEGTKTLDYNKREDNYNKVIGKLEALKLQIDSRPQPNNDKIKKLIQKVNIVLKNRGEKEINLDQINPSAVALKNIVDNLVSLKKDDQMQDVTKTEVTFIKNAIVLYLDQALTYENFLNQ